MVKPRSITHNESTDVTDFVSVISQTPCVSMETRRTLAKTFQQIVRQHGYILIIHFSFVGISCIIAILPLRVLLRHMSTSRVILLN